MKAITEGTLMPISFVVIVATGFFWASSVASDVRHNTADIQELQILKQKDSERLEQMARDMAVLRYQVEFLVKVEGMPK